MIKATSSEVCAALAREIRVPAGALPRQWAGARQAQMRRGFAIAPNILQRAACFSYLLVFGATGSSSHSPGS